MIRTRGFRYRIRSIIGDRAHVEMTPYDLSKGRIIYREKIAGHLSAQRRKASGGEGNAGPNSVTTSTAL